MTLTASSVVCPPRWATPRSDRPTIGGRIGKIAAALGTPFMPWQQQVADVGGEVDPVTGLLHYREIVVTLMRQQGKTTLQLPWMVDRCLSWPIPQHVTYAAQNGVAARDKLFDEHVPTILASPLAKAVRVRKTSGHEALLWRNGSRQTLTAAKETSGHGGVLDAAVIDEAFAYQDYRLEQAFRPAMQTRADPQLLVTSTAGYSELKSPYLWSKVMAGRALVESGEPSRVAYFEWSFSDDEDPFSEETWWRRMPALGHTTNADAIRAAAEGMEPAEFLRAFGNRWNTSVTAGVFEPGQWADCYDPVSTRMGGAPFMAVAVPPDRSAASIGVAARRSDGLLHVEVAEYRPGTGWVPERLAEMVRGNHVPAVVIDQYSPAASLMARIEAEGVPLLRVSARQYGQACGSFFDDVTEGRLRHIGQLPLTSAVEGAHKRAMGDAWAWARRNPSVDISPLEAVTLAAWAVDQPGGMGNDDITEAVW